SLLSLSLSLSFSHTHTHTLFWRELKETDVIAHFNRMVCSYFLTVVIHSMIKPYEQVEEPPFSFLYSWWDIPLHVTAQEDLILFPCVKRGLLKRFRVEYIASPSDFLSCFQTNGSTTTKKTTISYPALKKYIQLAYL
ncbi:unnamed protein product, partial [Coffea canephora]